MTELSLHTIKPAHGSRKKSFARGRGEGSGLGKTAGRGTKGQRARSGGTRGLQLKGMRRVLLRIPKVRGFTSHQSRLVTITLADLETLVCVRSECDGRTFEEREPDPRARGRREGRPDRNAHEGIDARRRLRDTGAKAAIEKAGGTVETAAKRAKSKRKK